MVAVLVEAQQVEAQTIPVIELLPVVVEERGCEGSRFQGGHFQRSAR